MGENPKDRIIRLMQESTPEDENSASGMQSEDADSQAFTNKELLDERERIASRFQTARSLRLKGAAVMAVAFILLAAPAFWFITRPALPSPYVAIAYIFILLALIYGPLRVMAEKLNQYRNLALVYQQRLEWIELELLDRGLEEKNWVSRLFRK